VTVFRQEDSMGSSIRLARQAGSQKASPAVTEPGAPDWVLLFLIIALCTAGLITVYSATAVESIRSAESLPEQFSVLYRQGTSLLIGLCLLGLGIFVHYRHLRGWILPLALLVVYLLLALLLFPNPLRGEPGPGGVAYRWLLDGSLRFQPAEVAKLVLVLFAANFLDKQWQQIAGRRFLGPFLVYGAVFGAAALMILREPDLGTAAVVAGTGFFMLVAAGMRWWWLALCAAGGAGGTFGLAYISPYRWQRVTAWLDPWADAHGDSYQSIQALIAIARGGWFGTGLGRGAQKLGYLPEQHTDFIIAVLAEELGLAGVAAVLLLFALLAWRGYLIAMRAPDRYSSLLASGITTMIVFQAFLNVAVVSGLFPVTGVPMPLISYGGSSLIVTLAGLGILLGISRRLPPGRSRSG
jgi:cell division protein FtsW